ncbi:hypothetical protein K6V98_07925 [Collinsella sp. AGMB00827]|uniref:tRNA-specific 2-thiouridylase MnmA n=2 Tax=Collinsella ureilytica TaxID=2869515 RepID=A0ABS7MLU8_9ACTN|nr:hypothetical protein [Collinsella urealyticum]
MCGSHTSSAGGEDTSSAGVASAVPANLSSLQDTELKETSNSCEQPQEDTSATLWDQIIAHAQNEDELYTLSAGADSSKDQSYVLYSLTQERLAHVLLPLGGLIKETDVRPIAERQGFGNAQKRDSQGICFVPDGDFAHYIEERKGELLAPGTIVDTEGSVLGQHTGAIRYTIGQRKGLGVAMLKPVYVTSIDTQTNTVVLGEEANLFASALVAKDWIWSAPEDAMRSLLDMDASAMGPGLSVDARIRYHQPSQRAHLSWDTTSPQHAQPQHAQTLDHTEAFAGAQRLIIRFDTPQRAIAPGQAVVVYAGDIVLGGGTVSHVLH